uniref:Smr/MutS family protein n=1 Tax=Pararhizobium sp. IMCC3301 TaxID=3067904 RepID=UPI00274148B9|nr:Smr/MutS family protein [Pararhizobium sp. IMCC3301]
MRRRRSRDLSPEERRLWNRVTESVHPARPKIMSDPEPAETGPQTSIESQHHVRSSSSRVAMPAYYPPVSTPKRPQALLLAPLDSKSRRRLKRGQNTLDATLDLHGLTQAAAHNRLIGFLHQAQAGGARYVLVITGKGKAVNADTGERGILRRMVPIWLSGPELAALVAGYDEAATPHGGTGALYVRLRRKRPGLQEI